MHFDHQEEIPCICGVRPAGPYSVIDLYEAGGVPAMEKIIEKYLNLDVKNVGGSTLRQMIEAAFLSLYAVTARPSHEGGVMQNWQDG